MARKSAKKPAKVAVEPGRAALPRSKREVPAHVKAAADRAEAMANGKSQPEYDPTAPRRRAKAAPKREKGGSATAPDKQPAPADAVPSHPMATEVGGDALNGRETASRPAHRPTDYCPEFVDRVKAMIGAVTDFDIAQELGVSTRTITRWKRIHTDFCLAISAKRELFDDEVEHSLATRATGFHYEDTHISSFQGMITQTPIVKYMPGDVSAQKHWLANRRPEKWRNDADGAPQVPAMSETDRNLFDVARKLVNVLHLAKLKTQQMANAVVISGESVRVEAGE